MTSKPSSAYKHRILGRDNGLFEVPEDFDAPLPPEVLAEFEGDVPPDAPGDEVPRLPNAPAKAG